MQTSLFAVLLILAVVAIPISAHVEVSQGTKATAECAVPTPTVTFKTSCTVVDVTDAACWTPHAPTAKDTVAFPDGTDASFLNHGPSSETPLVAENIVIERGAVVRMQGGGIEVRSCFAVHGLLSLDDKGCDGAHGNTCGIGHSTVQYSPTPGQPHGTDCATVSLGFTPRVCGPGTLVVHAKVEVVSLYASVFATTVVAPKATLVAGHGGFLWGNTTVHGTLTSEGILYLHGNLFNTGTSNLNRVRPDIWVSGGDLPADATPVFIVNDGFLTISSHANMSSAIVAADVAPNKRTVALKLINNANFTFDLVTPRLGKYEFGVMKAAGHSFDIVNYGYFVFLGLPTMEYSGWWITVEYFQKGSFVNMGTLLANGISVWLNNYLSKHGHTATTNHGSFYLGAGAGIDKKSAEGCLKGAAKKATPPVDATPVKVYANHTCNPHSWNSGCPANLCCGKRGLCEESRCHNYGGMQGFCCNENAGCTGSSHGPYCGNTAFLWQIDTECVEGKKFVDRYDVDAVKPHVGADAELPVFGRHRYSFQGNSRIVGDGTGSVRFTEPIEITEDATLTVANGGHLRGLVENGMVPFASGRVVVARDGQYTAGIKTSFRGDLSFSVEAGGRLVVPRYNRADFHESASVRIDADAEFVVNGHVNVVNEDVASASLKQCAVVSGEGRITGDTAKSQC